jgi:hypothetical protein
MEYVTFKKKKNNHGVCRHLCSGVWHIHVSNFRQGFSLFTLLDLPLRPLFVLFSDKRKEDPSMLISLVLGVINCLRQLITTVAR